MKKYSIQVLSGIFISLLFVVSFNFLINPYDIFESPEIKGLNSYKSEVIWNTRLSRIYQLENVKPEVILLASSRGMVIPEEYFTDDMMTGFNLSLPSASTYELLRVFQHAQAVYPLKKVILALDEDFTETKQFNFSEDRLMVDVDGNRNEKKWLQRLKDIFVGLLSSNALQSSFRTISKQKLAPDTIDIKQANSDRVSRAGGHRQMFRTMEASMFSEYGGKGDSCHDLSAINNKKLIF